MRPGKEQMSPGDIPHQRKGFSVLSLLTENGFKGDKLNLGNLGETLETNRFITVNLFPPDSNIARFVYLRYSEGALSDALGGVVRGSMRSGEHTSAGVLVSRMREVLTFLRGERKAVGDKIFEDQAEQYATTIYTTLTRGPTGNNPGTHEKREALYLGLGKTIREEFPKAVEIPSASD